MAKGAYVSVPTQKGALTILEYIESTGTQHIDTGVKPNQNTRVVADMYVPMTAGTTPFGVRASSTYYYILLSSGKWYYGFKTSENNTGITTSGRVTIETYNGSITVNGTTQSYSTGAFSFSDHTLWVCALNDAGSQNAAASVKVYSFKIYDGDTLIRDFVPAKNASGEVGLYDNVNSQFHGNAGTGAFTAGSVVEEIGGETVGIAHKAKKLYASLNVLTNLIEDGSFESGLGVLNNSTIASDYTATRDSAEKVYGSYSAKGTFVNAKSGNHQFGMANVNAVPGHVYYAVGHFKYPTLKPSLVISSNEHSDQWGWLASAEGQTGVSEWQKLSVVYTNPSYSTLKIRYVVSNPAVGDVAYLDGCLLVDLTEAYGAGKEPTKEWCDANIGYFDGKKHIPIKGVLGFARKTKKAYIGDESNKARLWWSSGVAYSGTAGITLDIVKSPAKAATEAGQYAIFGTGQRTPSNAVDAVSQNLTKATITPLTTSRFHEAATCINGNALIGMGCSSASLAGKTLSSVEVYDSNLVKGSNLTGYYGRKLAAAHSSNHAMFGGGCNTRTNGTTTRCNTTFAVNTNLTSVSTSTLNGAREDLMAGCINENIVFAGGSGDNAYYSSMEIYNSNLVFSGSNTGMRGAVDAAANTKNYLLFAGCMNELSPSDTVVVLDKNLVKTTCKLPEAYRYTCGGTIDDTAVFIGGLKGYSSGTVVNYAVSFKDDLVAEVIDGFNSEVYKSGSAMAGNKLLFGGGNTEANTYVQTIHVFE